MYRKRENVDNDLEGVCDRDVKSMWTEKCWERTDI